MLIIFTCREGERKRAQSIYSPGPLPSLPSFKTSKHPREALCRWGRQEAVLCSRCNCVCLYIRVQLKMPHSTGDELSKFSGASSLKCHPPSSTVYHRPVLNADPMRLRGCFTGQRLNGPVCWPAPGLPMMNGQTQGLCPGVKRLPRTVQRDLGAGTQKSRCSGLIDDLWTWSLTSSLHGCRVERLVVTIWLMYWSADTGLLLKI